MFVVSVKSGKLFKIIALCVFGIFAVIGGIVSASLQSAKPVSTLGKINLRVSTSDERTAFFSQFGWQVDETPLEIKEIVIPEVFDETYTEYNEIQKQQGLDLEKYKGVRVKMFSYEILNYPGYTDSDGIIHGNILVYDNTVIGGDVCSVELNGFMHTFKLPDGQNETTQLSNP